MANSVHPVEIRYSGKSDNSEKPETHGTSSSSVSLEDSCNEYIHEILVEWESHESQYNVVPLKRVKVALFPLLVALRKKELGPVQLNQLANVLDGILEEDFSRAKQEYLTLSIGKGKFPIGLINVGIHERKQVQSSQAEQNMILDDWCVNIKRLINFKQWLITHHTDTVEQPKPQGQ